MTDTPESWTLRRAGRIPGAEAWEIVAGDDPAGKVFLQYGAHGVDGVLALGARASGAESDLAAVRARVVTAAAATADRHADEIEQRFGGRTFREEGSPVERAVEPHMAGGYL